MAVIQIESVKKPFDSPGAASQLIRIISKADAMGLLDDAGTIRVLDDRCFRKVMKNIEKAGLAKGRLASQLPRKGRDLQQVLERVIAALDSSPVPESEWKAVLQVLDYDLTARLLHLSESSIRRYASGERDTPQEAASRLHFLAVLIGHLRGGYNDYGIKRWFLRPRTFLEGKSVTQALEPGWDPDGPVAKAIEKDACWVDS